MKKLVILLLFSTYLISCDSGTVNYRNPFLPNYPVDLNINLNLPQYSGLKIAGNHIVDYSQGIKGIVIFNVGFNYVAYDLACPNQDLSSCSTLTISTPNAICPCDEAEYSLFNGTSPGKDYPLKPYRVQVNGDNLLIYN